MELPDIVLALRAVDEGELDRQDLPRLFLVLESWRRGNLNISCAEVLAQEFRVDPAKVRRWEEEAQGRPSQRIGKYRLKRRVGKGGMGVVFEAEHPNLDRRVAVKILPPGLGKGPTAVQRFLREVKSAGRFNHPNIVHAYDAGIDGDVPFLVMEFVEGENLFQILLDRGPVSAESALDWLGQAAQALAVLEEKGWVHGDGKPSNWILEDSGRLKLADLGLCRPFGVPRESEQVHGSPPYMAPEQLRRGSRVDPRTDLYSLGTTFYHLLTGQPPFDARSSQELARAHEDWNVTPIRDLRPDIPDEVTAIVERLMARRPEDRFASPRELLSSVEALRGEAPSPSATGPAARGRPADGGLNAPRGTRVVVLVAVALLLPALLALYRWGGEPRRSGERNDERAASPPVTVDEGAVGTAEEGAAAAWRELWQREPKDYAALYAWLEEEGAEHPRREAWLRELSSFLDGEAAPRWEALESRVRSSLQAGSPTTALEETARFPERFRVGRYRLLWQERREALEEERHQRLESWEERLLAAVEKKDARQARSVIREIGAEPEPDRSWYMARLRESPLAFEWVDQAERAQREDALARQRRRSEIRDALRRGELPAPWFDSRADPRLELAVAFLVDHPPTTGLRRGERSVVDELLEAELLATTTPELLVTLSSLFEESPALSPEAAAREVEAAALLARLREAARAWDADAAESLWARLSAAPLAETAVGRAALGWGELCEEVRRGRYLRSEAFVAGVEGEWGSPPILTYSFTSPRVFEEWRHHPSHWSGVEDGQRCRASGEGAPLEALIPFGEGVVIEVDLIPPPPPWILMAGQGESLVGIRREHPGELQVLSGSGRRLRSELEAGHGRQVWPGDIHQERAVRVRVTSEGDRWRLRLGTAEARTPRSSSPDPAWVRLVIPPGAILRQVRISGWPHPIWLDSRRQGAPGDD